MANYYETLGLKPTASNGEIREAYRAMAKKYHPDKNLDNPHSEEVFKRINLAYQVLSDQQKRYQYDQSQIYQTVFTTHTTTASSPSPTYAQGTPYSGASTSQGPYRNTTHQSYRTRRVYRTKSRYRYAHISKRTRRLLHTAAVFVGLGVLALGAYIYDVAPYIAARHYYQEALEFVQEKQYDRALSKLNEAVAFNPALVKAHMLLGKINDSVYSQPSIAYINYNRAIFYSEHPTADMYYQRGLTAFKSKKTQAAAEDFGQVEILEPERAETYFYRGLAYWNLWKRPYNPNISRLACEDIAKAIRMGYQPARQRHCPLCFPQLPLDIIALIRE